VVKEYTDNQLKEIMHSGTFTEWEALQKEFTIVLCQQIKHICEPFNERAGDKIHPHWFGLAHKFLCNEESKKNLANRYSRKS